MPPTQHTASRAARWTGSTTLADGQGNRSTPSQKRGGYTQHAVPARPEASDNAAHRTGSAIRQERD